MPPWDEFAKLLVSLLVIAMEFIAGGLVELFPALAERG